MLSNIHAAVKMILLILLPNLVLSSKNGYHTGTPNSSWTNMVQHQALGSLEKLEKQPLLQTVILAAIGETLTIPCDVLNIGNNSVIWSKDEEELLEISAEMVSKPHLEGRYGHKNTSIVITDIRAEDEGVYLCKVSPNGETDSQKVEIGVPPSAWPSDQVGFVQDEEGSSVVFSCSVSGKPRPNVTWERQDSGELTGKAIETEFSIENITASDAGIYACEASNGIGQPARALFTLDVYYVPRVTAVVETVHTGEGYNAILSCLVESSPFPRVTWFKEGVPVNPMRLYKGIDKNNKFSLIFDHVIRDDLGFYSCNASNFWGSDSAVVELTGRPLAPEITSAPIGIFVDQYSLTWEVKSFAPITHYELIFKNLTDEEGTWVNITVPGLQSPSMYHSQRFIIRDITRHDPVMIARVRAANEFGHSEWSLPFVFQTSNDDKLLKRRKYANEILEVPVGTFGIPKMAAASDSETSLKAASEAIENFRKSNGFPILLKNSADVSSSCLVNVFSRLHTLIITSLVLYYFVSCLS